jgi:hypothetical protein
MRNAYKILVGNTEGKRANLGHLSVYGGTVLKLILKKQGMRVWTALN